MITPEEETALFGKVIVTMTGPFVIATFVAAFLSGAFNKCNASENAGETTCHRQSGKIRKYVMLSKGHLLATDTIRGVGANNRIYFKGLPGESEVWKITHADRVRLLRAVEDETRFLDDCYRCMKGLAD